MKQKTKKKKRRYKVLIRDIDDDSIETIRNITTFKKAMRIIKEVHNNNAHVICQIR